MICGIGAPIDFNIGTPPAASAGKNFIAVMPFSSSAIAWLGSATPGNKGTPVFNAASINFSVVPGLTINSAPASIAALSVSMLMIVPAPTIASGTSALMRRIDSSAASVLRVISRTFKPPLTKALAKGTACSTLLITITGTIGDTFMIS